MMEMTEKRKKLLGELEKMYVRMITRPNFLSKKSDEELELFVSIVKEMSERGRKAKNSN